MLVLAGIIILGILAQWIAWRVKIPAILPLILIGLMVGPLSTLFTESGCKLIQPTITEGCNNYLFPGDLLFYFVSLAIGIILFEGGMTLKIKEIQGVGPVIGKLISLGSLITFGGATVACHYLMNVNWSVSFLFAALIIVTGPTVIAPILRNIPLKKNTATVLKWEGILIDPIGALAAVIVFEFIVAGLEGGHSYGVQALKDFVVVMLVGFSLGFTFAHLLAYLIKKELIPHYLLNVASLALVLFVFAFSDLISAESGLLSVVVMGLVLGNLDIPKLKEVFHFKESLSVLLISILFIVLSANMNMADLELILSWNCLFLFLTVILIIRPLGVFASTLGSNLDINEKIFISWVGPRGIVAAGIASLFGIKLVTQFHLDGAEYITPLVFMIVLGTVLLNATTARMVAKTLGVMLEKSEGILMIGANSLSRVIAKYLQDSGRHVALIDSNVQNIRRAKSDELSAFNANIYTDELGDFTELSDMGYLMAMTGSKDVNEYAISKLGKEFGENGSFRVMDAEEKKLNPAQLPTSGLISYTSDYHDLNDLARSSIKEIPVSNTEEMQKIVSMLIDNNKSLPLFFKSSDGNFEFLPKDLSSITPSEGAALIYIGRKLE